MVILRQFWKLAVLFAAIAFAFTGCGGRDAIAPFELRQQAFEDLRGEIRDAIDDPAREAEAIAKAHTRAMDAAIRHIQTI